MQPRWTRWLESPTFRLDEVHSHATAGEVDRQMVAQCVPVDERVDRSRRSRESVMPRLRSVSIETSEGLPPPWVRQGYALQQVDVRPGLLDPLDHVADGPGDELRAVASDWTHQRRCEHRRVERGPTPS